MNKEFLAKGIFLVITAIATMATVIVLVWQSAPWGTYVLVGIIAAGVLVTIEEMRLPKQY